MEDHLKSLKTQMTETVSKLELKFTQDMQAHQEANKTAEDALLARINMLNQKQEAKDAEMNERVEEAARCIELLKESVERLGTFLEEGL